MILPLTDALCAALAACVAKAASALPRRDRREGLKRKADGSIVTAADLACEAMLRQLIAPVLPGIPVIGEEGAGPDERLPDAPMIALIDPLDGTAAYADGRDDYSINLALVRNGVAVLGILGLPAQGRVFAGLCDGDRRDATVRTCNGDGHMPATATSLHVDAAAAQGLTGLVSERHGDAESEAALARAGIVTRLAASSASKFAIIAEGRGHLYPRYGATMAWDTAAGQALLTAAGGCVITPDTGEPLRYPPGRPLRNGPFIAASSRALALTAAGLA